MVRQPLVILSRKRGRVGRGRTRGGVSAAMARGSVANNLKLSWLLLRGGVRQAGGRVNGHPLLRWPLPPLRAGRLLISPQDLRNADAPVCTAIYSGPLRFAR